MFALTVLGSGSAGNCAVVECDGTRVLVDAGFSGKQIRERLATIGRSPDDLDAILLTHEHGDHTAGLPVLCERANIPLYCTRPTADILRDQLKKFGNWHLFNPGDTFPVGNLTVESFSVPHDAADPVGFVLRGGGGVLGFLTDLGHATTLAVQRVRACNAVVLESNYDRDLLQRDTKRPWATKQRIQGRHGHLSNDEAAKVAAAIASPVLHTILLGHLSADCNTPEKALGTMRSALADCAPHIRVEVLAQEQVSPRFEIAPAAAGQVWGERVASDK